ncbi:hypothetical protein ONZ45_g17228 [Pleurotus djamor]|nr:hypothetical protein ONZ45_g17228 [Pleurotus djamor]
MLRATQVAAQSIRPFYGLPLGLDKGHAKRDVIPVINPADGQELCSVVAANAVDVATTIDNAQAVFESGVWSKASSIFRSKVLSRMARNLEERIADVAQKESLQTGRTIREMNAQLGRLPEWLDYFAALLRTTPGYIPPTQGKLLNYVQRIPLGVVAQITPFNHPLLIAVKKIAPALAAGNSVIVKPSELAPITVIEFVEMATESGLPQGVLTVLPGPGHTTGKDIISNPLIRKVDITAGTRTGQQLGAIVGANLAAYTAELGGKAPIVIFDDVDLESAVNGAAFAAFVASGQTCVSGTRLIVQSGVYDQFLSEFVQKAESIRERMGNPLNPRSAMGTVISERHLVRIESMVTDRSSGSVVTGGKRMSGPSPLDGYDLSKGSFFPPTVITDIDVEDTLWKEEIFGPVVVVKRFETEEEGIQLANASKVAADIQSGLCWVNTHHRNDPSSPWGGMKESGIGRENGLEALHSYSQSKSIIINTATVEESRQSDDWFSEGAERKRYG